MFKQQLHVHELVSRGRTNVHRGVYAAGVIAIDHDSGSMNWREWQLWHIYRNVQLELLAEINDTGRQFAISAK